MSTNITPTAITPEQADAYVGSHVRFDPDHPDNSDDMMISMVGDMEGEVIESFIIDDGDFKGTHAFSVTFMSPMFSGTVRPVTADRFLMRMDA